MPQCGTRVKALTGVHELDLDGRALTLALLSDFSKADASPTKFSM